MPSSLSSPKSPPPPLPKIAIKWRLWISDAILAKIEGARYAVQSMNISLPDPLKQFVDGQIAEGRYSSVSEYVRELIRADEQRKAQVGGQLHHR